MSCIYTEEHLFAWTDLGQSKNTFRICFTTVFPNQIWCEAAPNVSKFQNIFKLPLFVIWPEYELLLNI